MLKTSTLNIFVLVYFLLASVFVISDFGHLFDYFIFDQQTKVNASFSASDPKIVVIAIDDYSLQEMNTYVGGWMWPRSVHAELIEGLSEVGVRSIVFDIIFADQDIYRPDDDMYLNEVIAKFDNVFMPVIHLNTEYQSGTLLNEFPAQLGIEFTHSQNTSTRAQFLLPIAITSSSWNVGTINFNADTDGVGRRYEVKRDVSGSKIMSLPAKVGDSFGVQLPEKNEVILNWSGNIDQPYETFHFADVYRAIISGDTNKLNSFKGKHVLIGATAAGLYDTRVTPINHNLPGVYMLATALDNLLNKRYFNEVDISVYLLILSLSSLFLYGSIRFVGNFLSQMFSLLFLALFGSVILLLFSSYLMSQLYLLLVGKLIFVMIFGFISMASMISYQEYLHRKKTEDIFSRFLDPIMVKRLTSNQKLDLTQLNQKTSVSVLFTDIRNFTSFSEDCDADEVVDLLNKYFTNQVAIVFKHGGTLDKFIGDCIMAFWGAPTSNEDHAVAAINAALEMERELLKFKQSLPAHLTDFEIGIGIHSGTAIVGMIGTEQRVDYTAIGDTVNLASRIEGLTKHTSRILVSEQTMLLSKSSFGFDFIGEEVVKGRLAKVKLYRPNRKE